MSAACPSDGSFGPGVGSCRGGFDFTLGFEESMLGLLPQAALLLLAPVRLATLQRRRKRVARQSHLGFLKAVAGFCYVVSSIVLLALWSEVDSFKTSLSIAAAALEFLGSLLIVTLSQLEHSRAVRPSHLLQFFLLLLLLCDAVRLRTLFLMDYPTSIVTPASIHTFLTGSLLLLESLDKRELFRSDGDRRLPPEETMGLFGKRVFWYLNGLFNTGYRKILKPADLHGIDTDLGSQERVKAFQEAWEAQYKKGRKQSLLRVIVKVLWLDMLRPVLPRFIKIAATLTQPYLITSMVSFIRRRDETDSLNEGYGLIAAFALNYTVLAIASGWSAQSIARFQTKLRGCLIATIYEKTLNSTLKDVDPGTATVLMNVDVAVVLEGCKKINHIWAAIISSSFALYVLYSNLGVAFLASFLTILIGVAVITWIGAAMKDRQLLLAAAIERRINAITYIAGNMKGVRMLGLSETVLQMLTNLRRADVDAGVFLRKLMIWVTLVSNSMFQLTTLTTYVTFAVIILIKDNGKTLDLNNLYGSLSALKLFAAPFTLVLQSLPALQVALASLERIENFLQGEINPKEGAPESIPGSDVDGTELFPLNVAHTKAVITLEKATFGINDQPLLLDVTTHFSPDTFSMIVGKVGSGKSILLRSLVGETTLTSGHFQPFTSGTAFCDQQVWLRNATVRENIVGESPFDMEWYQKVIWSCGLLQDLRELKNGDGAAIGSKGIQLSGGQKNRVSLARAIYARKPVLVLDDMLAGLDNNTEKAVFHRVFGPSGILRRSEATVILATHATHYAQYADRIIVMSEGQITEQGTYQELVDKKVDFRKLNDDHAVSDANDKTEHSTLEDESDLILPDSVVADEEEIEDTARQSGDRRSMMFFLKAIGPKHMTISSVSLIAGIVMTQIQFFWLKWWAESDDKSRSGTIRRLYLFVIITLVNISLYLVYFAHFGLWFQPRLSLKMHARQLVALMRARFSFLVSTDIGSITNRFSQDILLVDLQLPVAWFNVTFEVIVTICTIVIMSIATPPVAATLPILIAVGYCVQRVYLRTSRQVRLMDLEAKAPLCTHFLETMAGMVTVRAFGWTEAYRKRNEELLNQSQVPYYLLAAIQNWLTLVLELAVAGMITLIVGLAVALRHKIDPGYLGLALISAMDLNFNFQVIIVCWTDLETSLSAVVRILQFSAAPPEQGECVTVDPPESWPERGAVTFENLAASYSEDGKEVLSNVNLDIKDGEKIGICGRTGSGKSSLVATLFGLLHQREGQIVIDDVPIAGVSLAVLRSKIIALPQEPLFLKGTVRYNLAPWMGEDRRAVVSDEQMKDALGKVQLWEKLDGVAGEGQSGLDVNLDNVESLLSQGERQLFCLARAILMDGKIVVLDEATSSVDAQTDALMQRVLRTAFADRTIIAIAHRLDTILDFDRVVVMEAGRIAEVGPPDELLRTEESLFRALVEGQK